MVTPRGRIALGAGAAARWASRVTGRGAGAMIGGLVAMTLDKSMHPGFTRDTSHYRGILRADGQPKWNAVRTPKVGDTVSPFVVTATRS